MTEILTDLSPESLAVAIKANLYDFFRLLHTAPSAGGNDFPEGFRWSTGLPYAWFNGVLYTSFPGAATEQAARDLIDYFQAREIPAFTWWLAPSLAPAAWAQYLRPLGFAYEDQTPGMAMDLENLPSRREHALTIQPVFGGDALTAWAETMLAGFGFPDTVLPAFQTMITELGLDLPVRNYLGWFEGKPVTTSTLFLAAGVAGVYNVATLPEARGQGFGSAMTLAPLYEARAMGYRAGTLQSSEIGFGVYQRLGFEQLCQIDHFTWQEEDPQAEE
jgi:ribosomal protein S18 acetylase RimI-like enzyme